MLALFWHQCGDLLIKILYFCLLLFLVGLYYIFKPRVKFVNAVQATVPSQTEKPVLEKLPVNAKEDFAAIAGDDVLSTQLDLARALVETGSKKAAQKILTFVLAKGNQQQQEEAKQLIAHI